MIPSAYDLLGEAEAHFAESESGQSSEGRQRATERASVRATMAIAKALIELREAIQGIAHPAPMNIPRPGLDDPT
jgi:hypothetical protein